MLRKEKVKPVSRMKKGDISAEIEKLRVGREETPAAAAVPSAPVRKRKAAVETVKQAKAMEFPPENEEQRSKLWGQVVGALLEIEQRTVKVLGRDFEDVSGWAQGGRIPNVRQLAEMRLIAASTNSVGTGRLCSARWKPTRIFATSKSAREPSFLTTCGILSSTVS